VRQIDFFEEIKHSPRNNLKSILTLSTKITLESLPVLNPLKNKNYSAWESGMSLAQRDGKKHLKFTDKIFFISRRLERLLAQKRAFLIHICKICLEYHSFRGK